MIKYITRNIKNLLNSDINYLLENEINNFFNAQLILSNLCKYFYYYFNELLRKNIYKEDYSKDDYELCFFMDIKYK